MPASITLTVSHLPTSTSFFLSSLQPLNYVYRGRVNDTIGFGHPDAAPDFWITQSVPGVPPGPAHVAFPATSQREVHDFFSNAVRAGAKVHGTPALRDLQSGYYSAAVIDFDGNSIEAVYRPDLLEQSKTRMSKSSRTVVTTANSKQPTNVSTAAKSKSPTVVSSASKMSKGNPASPTEISRAILSATAQSSASKSPTETRSIVSMEAPRSSTSKANSATAQPPRGDVIDNIIANAQGAVSMAKELVNQARPHMTSTNANGDNSTNSGPSDAIVGTLFGVAAGAALHYALSRRDSHDQSASAPTSRRASPPYGGIARSETVPSYTEERHKYYHDPPNQQRVIEAAPSNHHPSQRLIELIDNDPTIVPRTTFSRPRRRSSASDLSQSTAQRSYVTTSRSRTSKATDAPPPSSYRAPAVSTQLTRSPSTTSKSQSTSRRRSSSTTPSSATTIKLSHSRHDEGYASAYETRSKTSHSSASVSKPNSKSAAPSRTPSHRSSTSRHHRTSHQSPPTPSEASLHVPPSRAATWAPTSTSNPRSTTSAKPVTVIGRLTEAQLRRLEENRGGSLKGVTRSVVGKVREADRLNVSRREVGPEDSVSQC